MSLFNHGAYHLHAGQESNFLIDCEQLTDSDLEAVAALVRPKLPTFRTVVGIPKGGLRFAEALEPYATPDGEAILLVDDVLTTGSSMKEYSNGLVGPIVGAVIFSRGLTPAWIKAAFQMI